MGKFDNKDGGIYHAISFFFAEIATTDGLVRAQSWPIVRAQATTLWPSTPRVIQELF